MSILKKCFTCKVEKPLSGFHKDKTGVHGVYGECKECACARRRNNYYVREYGLSLEEFQALVDLQNSSCAICEDPLDLDDRRRTHVDHDHETGIVRGILCVNCNVAIAGLRHNPIILKAAIAYLERG